MIYTDKLPEDCGRCSCRDIEYGLCQLQHDMEMANGKGANTIDIWAYADTGHRPDNCPLILIEQWRLESCQTCFNKYCSLKYLNRAGFACEDWQPIENNLI